MPDKPTIRFEPSGVEVEASAGESVFAIGRRAGIVFETACVGKGTCGLCRIVVLEGEDHFSSYNETEEKHLGNVYWLTKTRLSCQTVWNGTGRATVRALRK